MNLIKVFKHKKMKSKSYLPYNSKLVYKDIITDYENMIINTFEKWQSNTDPNTFYTIEYEENIIKKEEKNEKN